MIHRSARSIHAIPLAALMWAAAFPIDVPAAEPPAWRSHPPLRVAPPPSSRPLAGGAHYFVHPDQGNDASDGSQQAPWKTIRHALDRLKAGDTLCLRGGTYFETVRVGIVGTKDAPITVRSYPGEQATINGGIRELFEQPENSWETVAGGAAGEYRTVHSYPGTRDVVGAFGDSFVGLQTYWHREDLAAANELWKTVNQTGVAPVYCGPGIWYDRTTGRIHARLAHTNFDWPGVPNYRGETDPRKLPLVIAPFRAVPLHVDGAQYVRFQDLVICGGGYNTVLIEQGLGIEFDNVTVRCGTYGLVAYNTREFRFHNSALYGNMPPWGSRVEASLNTDHPGGRDVARLTAHALLVANGHDEYSVYCYPFNRDWEISYSEFTEGSDGLYLGGVNNLRFHHNLVDNCHDDGIYLSQISPYAPQEIHLYQNKFSRCLTTLAFGGVHPPRGPVYIYRNVFDLSGSLNGTRPKEDQPRPNPTFGKLIGDHGSPKWAPLFFYQNTCIQSGESGRHWIYGATSKERPYRVMNNLFVYFNRLPGIPTPPPAENDFQSDGNLFWKADAKPGEQLDFLGEFRKSKPFEASKARYAPGWEANSIVADPMFAGVKLGAASDNDYRPRQGSPAIGGGVNLPTEWADPLRPADGKKPDIGALPVGATTLEAGRKK